MSIHRLRIALMIITCNPRISSIDGSGSTVPHDAFDVWGVGSLSVQTSYLRRFKAKNKKEKPMWAKCSPTRNVCT